MLKEILKKIVLGNKASSESYIAFLRKKGTVIGENCTIFSPHSVYIDETRPWMIRIGNNVKITRGTTILTHGYDWSVLKGVYGEVLGSSGGVSIGDNVFIGMQTTILKGVHIGNNVIIGANSLVNKDIPDNSVAAGNPCKVIMSLQEYYEKRKKAQYEEAKELVINYRNVYGTEPDEYALREFFWLFSDNSQNLPKMWRDVNSLCGNAELTNKVMNSKKSLFRNREEFLNSISNEG